MRALLSLAVLALSACSSTEYRDTNAAVDANPLCVGSHSDVAGNTGPMDCERDAGTVLFRIESGKSEEPIDLSGERDG